jgi:hypothetical protein
VASQALQMLIGSNSAATFAAEAAVAPPAPSSQKATGAFPRPGLPTEQAAKSNANAGEITIKKSGQRADQLAAKVLDPELLDEAKVPQAWREKWTKEVDAKEASGESATVQKMGAQSAGPKALQMEAKVTAEFRRMAGNMR